MNLQDDSSQGKIQATQKFFEEVGLSALPEAEKPDFLKHVTETLQLRVGQRLVKFLNPTEIKEFNNLIESKNQQQAIDFLHKKIPQHSQILKEEMIKLQNEIKNDAPKILESLE